MFFNVLLLFLSITLLAFYVALHPGEHLYQLTKLFLGNGFVEMSRPKTALEHPYKQLLF